MSENYDQSMRPKKKVIGPIILVIIVLVGILSTRYFFAPKELSTSTELPPRTKFTRPAKWPARIKQYDQEASQIPTNSTLSMVIDESHPIVQSGSGGIDTYGNFMPGSDFTIISGPIRFSIGQVNHYALVNDWAYIYQDSTKEKKIGWGPCLTQGELLIHRNDLLNNSFEGYVENQFECVDYGPDYFLVKLNPSKNHRILVQEPSIQDMIQGKSYTITAGCPGTIVKVNNMILFRKTDGWYK